MTKRPATRSSPKKKAEPTAKAAKPKAKRAAAPKASKPTKAEAAPPPPRPEYDLNGPVPKEGAGLPKKVGALLGIGQQPLHIKNFRPGQAEAFEHLLAGEDLLAVMPTGSGKSLLNPLPTLVVPGVTVVDSQLHALL